MYVDSLDVNNSKPNNRVLRRSAKYILKVDRKVGTKYQRSPFYMGLLVFSIGSLDMVSFVILVRY